MTTPEPLYDVVRPLAPSAAPAASLAAREPDLSGKTVGRPTVSRRCSASGRVRRNLREAESIAQPRRDLFAVHQPPRHGDRSVRLGLNVRRMGIADCRFVRRDLEHHPPAFSLCAWL
jgi:hypothetical protein